MRCKAIILSGIKVGNRCSRIARVRGYCLGHLNVKSRRLSRCIDCNKLIIFKSKRCLNCYKISRSKKLRKTCKEIGCDIKLARYNLNGYCISHATKHAWERKKIKQTIHKKNKRVYY